MMPGGGGGVWVAGGKFHADARRGIFVEKVQDQIVTVYFLKLNYAFPRDND
jgi:hypothetical protein